MREPAQTKRAEAEECRLLGEHSTQTWPRDKAMQVGIPALRSSPGDNLQEGLYDLGLSMKKSRIRELRKAAQDHSAVSRGGRKQTPF